MPDDPYNMPTRAQHSTVNDAREPSITRTTTEARQGIAPGIVRYVLAGSLALAAVMAILLYLYVVYWLR